MRIIDADTLMKSIQDNFDNLNAYFPSAFIKEVKDAPTVKTYCYFCGQTEHGQIEERPPVNLIDLLTEICGEYCKNCPIIDEDGNECTDCIITHIRGIIGDKEE